MTNTIAGNITSTNLIDEQIEQAPLGSSQDAGDSTSYTPASQAPYIPSNKTNPLWSPDGALLALNDSEHTLQEDFPTIKPEFDVGVAGLRHGVIPLDEQGTLGLLPPSNPTVEPSELRKLDISGVWSEHMMKTVGDVNQTDFDLAHSLETPLRQLLWLMCYNEFVPILNKYKDSPEDLAYAGAIFNGICDSLEKATRLGDSIMDYKREPLDFLAAVEDYYTHPSESTSNMPLTRVNVDRLMLSRVDDTRILFDHVLEHGDQLVFTGQALRNEMPYLEAQERMDVIQSYATSWSAYFYDENILPGPISGALLPEELKAELPKSFENRDDRNLFNQLVPFENGDSLPPPNASLIIGDFKVGLERILGIIERTTIPLEFQMIGGNIDVYSFRDPWSLDEMRNAEILNRLPTSDSASARAEDEFFDLVSFSEDMDIYDAWDQFVYGSDMLQFQQEINDTGIQLTQEILRIGEGIEISVQYETAEAMVDQVFYNWLELFILSIIGKESVTSVWEDVHKRICSIEQNIDDSTHTSDSGSSFQASELKPLYRETIIIMLDRIASILYKHRDCLFSMVDQIYGELPSTQQYPGTFKQNYEYGLWFFETWAELYRGYDADSKKQYPDIDAESIAQTSPIILSLKQASKDTLTVLEEAHEVVQLPLDDPHIGYYDWTTYQSFKGMLKTNTGEQTSSVLVDYLEGQESDAVLLVSLKEWSEKASEPELQILKAHLFDSYDALETTSWNYLAPQYSLDFLNRVRSLINVVVYLEHYKEKCAERVDLNLAEESQKNLLMLYERAPYGWPQPNGKTPDNLLLDQSFTPNTDYYLDFEEVISLLSFESTDDAAYTIQQLSDFFAHFEDGYLRYFIVGGNEYNAYEDPIRYSRRYAFIDQFLLVLEDLAKIAQVQLDAGVLQTEVEIAYAEKMKEVCRQVSLNILDELERSELNIAHHAIMPNSIIYEGTVPADLSHPLKPSIGLGTFDEVIALRAQRILDKSRVHSDDVISEHASDFSLGYALPSSSHEDFLRFGVFETNMSAVPKPSSHDYYSWTVSSAGLFEMQYIMGRLWEKVALKDKDQDKLEKNRIELIKAVERTLVETLRYLPQHLQQFTYNTPEVLAFYHEGLSKLLVDLHPVQAFWLCGYVQKKLKVHDDFEQSEAVLDLIYEDKRQDDLDAYLDGLKQDKAEEKLVDLLQQHNIDSSFISETDAEHDPLMVSQNMSHQIHDYYLNPSMLTYKRDLRDLYVLCSGDDLREAAGNKAILTRYDLLYLTTLLAKDLFEEENDPSAGFDLALDELGPDSFNRERVLAVYDKISEDEKKNFYAFAYYQSWGYYLVGIEDTILANQGEFYRAVDKARDFWSFLQNVPSLVDEGRFNSANASHARYIFDFDEKDLELIVAAWRNNGIKPAIPAHAQKKPEHLSMFIDSQMDDPKFFAENQAAFRNHVFPRSGFTAERKASFWLAFDQIGNLSDQEIRELNITLLRAIHPLLAEDMQERQAHVQTIDQAIEDEMGLWTEFSDMPLDKMDPLTQALMVKTLDDLIELYADAGKQSVKHQIAAQAYTTIKDMLLGYYDTTSPASRTLYSQYNPYGDDIERDVPRELAVLYSPDRYCRMSGNDNPYLLSEIEPVLENVRLMVEGNISESDFRTFVRQQYKSASLEAFLDHYDSVYKPNTIAFYEMRDSDKVPEVTEKMEFIESELSQRLAQLKPTENPVARRNSGSQYSSFRFSPIVHDLEEPYE
jgi:hypothetical protein